MTLNGNYLQWSGGSKNIKANTLNINLSLFIMKKKVIFFGGSGFLGKYFCENIIKNNHDLTIIDIVFIWFYIVNGFTITAFSLSSLITEKIHYYTSGFLKFVIPLSLISIAVYLNKRVQNNRKDIILDRDL